MNYQERLHKLYQRLTPYEVLWNNEVLNIYPDSLQNYPSEWVDALWNHSEQELWNFDGKNDLSKINYAPLKKLLSELTELCQLDKAPKINQKELPEWAFIKVKEKKKHEILSLLPHLKKVKQGYKVIDIGGGVGHMSRIISHYTGLDTICLEQNQKLIEVGKKRFIKYPIPEGSGKTEFIHATFGEDPTDHIFNAKSFSLGLHTCGPLAVNHIRSSVKNDEAGMINFGCCYPRITQESDLNLSAWAKENPLPFNEFSLTLATRSHSDHTFRDYETKWLVKKYRYMLHLFLYYKQGITEFITLGNSPLRLYRESFAEYARFNLERADINVKAKELDEFYRDKKMQETTRRLYLANLIRWKFGRPLEVFILTDRAQYLKESGFEVSMKEYFDETISPRNIGISAQRACRNT